MPSTNTIFLRGLNYGPGDLSGLADALGEPIYAPDNPLYRGELPKGKDRREYENELANDVAIELSTNIPWRIIAHSRGTYFALLVARRLTQLNPQIGSQNTPSVIFLGPVPRDPKEVPLDDSAQDLMHMIYNPMRGKMDDKTYAAMLGRHEPTAKKALKTMDPKKHGVSPSEVNAVLREVPERIRIMLIRGNQEFEPFFDDKRLKEMLGDREVDDIVLECGHFPHIECPEIVAKIILQLEALRRMGRQAVDLTPPNSPTSPSHISLS